MLKLKKIHIALLVLVCLCLQVFSTSKIAANLFPPAAHVAMESSHTHDGHSHDEELVENKDDYARHTHSHHPADHSHDIAAMLSSHVGIRLVAYSHLVVPHLQTAATLEIHGLERPPRLA